MNRILPLTLGAALLLGSVPSVHANEMMGVPPSQMVDKHLDMLTKKLSLTSEQQQKARGILLDEAGQLDPLAAQMKTIHDASDAKLNDILKPDQQKKFAAWKADKMEDMQKKMKK